jgi:hypothetical protein
VGCAGATRLAVVGGVARKVVVLVVLGVACGAAVEAVVGAAVGAAAATEVVVGGGRKWAIRPTNTTADAVPAASRDRWDMPPRIDPEPGRRLWAG